MFCHQDCTSPLESRHGIGRATSRSHGARLAERIVNVFVQSLAAIGAWRFLQEAGLCPVSRPRYLSWSAIHVPSIGERHAGWPTQCRVSIAQVLEDDGHICVDFVWLRTCSNDRAFRSLMEANRKLCRGVPAPSDDENSHEKLQNVVAYCKSGSSSGTFQKGYVGHRCFFTTDRSTGSLERGRLVCCRYSEIRFGSVTGSPGQ